MRRRRFALALACDFRVLDETATFGQAYTSAGLNIDGGGTFMLPRLVGLARALELAAFDEPMDAAHAACSRTRSAQRSERAAVELDVVPGPQEFLQEPGVPRPSAAPPAPGDGCRSSGIAAGRMLRSPPWPEPARGTGPTVQAAH